ncbi:MAG: 5-formyltetrahydrofolate cyclo-ligase [Chloroflexi bacterium]|nr:5-formyltetrahydrofolate cyclo-ligase [Chloroflexota bacterium]
MNPNAIRQQYRQARRSLSVTEQTQHAIRLQNNIDTFLRFSHPIRIAAYLATQGEISLDRWISANPKQRIYLPKLYEVIAPKLRFAELTSGTRWTHNRFNIIEPDCHWGDTLSAQRMDVILLPLVAFDRKGYRLGMGGGYYDRSLAFRRSRQQWRRPRLIGVAHSCQQHPGLPQQHWDVPLDCIITESEIIPIR